MRSTAEVLSALRRLPGLRDAYAERYAAFRQTFCPLDDGLATERLRWLADLSSPERELAETYD